MIDGMSSATPDISVVIPLFEAEAFIVATLDSVLAQTLPAREVIVVDDGSTDRGPALVEAIADPRVRLIRQANAGPGAARNTGAGAPRNTGISAARGAWVALIDADDLWRSDHLANLAAVIAAHPAADAVAAASVTFEAGAFGAGMLDSGLPPPDDERAATTREIDLFRDHRSDLFNASSIAFRRAAFTATTGFGTFGAGEDTEFWIRFALDHRIAISTRPTALYRRSNGGIMDREQARMARGDPMLVSPVFATLDAALLAPAHAARHAAIRAYADRTRIAYARSRVYHGQGIAARALLANVTHWNAARGVLTALSLLPKPVLQYLSRNYSRAKRMLR